MPGTITCARSSVFHNEWRRPGIDLVAIHAPEFFACPLVEGDDKRLAALLIPDDDKAVAMQRRRASLTELIAHALVAEILLPKSFAIHVEGVQALGFEERKECSPSVTTELEAHVPLSVCDPSCGASSRTVRSHTTFAVAAIDGHDHESMRNAGLNAASRRMLRVSADADGHCGHEIDAIAPDHGRA